MVSPDADRSTPLIAAAQGGHTGAMRRLLEAGAVVSMEGGGGATARGYVVCGRLSPLVFGVGVPGCTVSAVSY